MSDAPILAGVNKVADLDAAGDFERKHTPHIECERIGDKVVVEVTVGHDVSHPNQPDHFIEWIEIQASGAPLARFDLAAVAVDPKVTCVINVDSGTALTAMESCNLHGVWVADAIAP